MREGIAAYARLSLDRYGNELAVERQHADIDALAKRRGWIITERYTDNNVSAFQQGVVRPQFERLVTDLKEGRIKGVLAYDLDRLWRKPSDLERIIDIYQITPGLVFATIQADYDLSTSDGRLSARVLAASAAKSSEDTARRVKRKLQEQAEAGIPHWGKLPYGYNRDGSLNQEEAAVVRRMGEIFLSGFSYRECAWQLNESGLRTRSGDLWQVSQIRKFMDQPRFAGIRVHNGERYKGTWTPIFTASEWEQIEQTVKQRRENFKGTPSNRKYLLTGLLVCRCGTHLRGMTKRDGLVKTLHNAPPRPLRRTYQCPSSSEKLRRLDSCAGTCVGAVPLEHFIREAICYRLDSPEFLEQLTQDSGDDERIQELRAQLSEVQQHRASIIDDYTDRVMSRPDYLRAIERIDKQVRALEYEVDQLRASRIKLDIKPGESVRNVWLSKPDGWRRELIETLISRIDIGKSSRIPYYLVDGKRTRFDMARVSIEWKV